MYKRQLFNTGVLERFGKVEDGTTTSDYDPEEIKRRNSLFMSICPCEWKNHKINIIDVPGYLDVYKRQVPDVPEFKTVVGGFKL